MPDVATLELFADELRRARVDAGFSQEALAQRISYSPSLIAKIELAQRRPTREFARHCDDVLSTGGRLGRIQRVVGRCCWPARCGVPERWSSRSRLAWSSRRSCTATTRRIWSR